MINQKLRYKPIVDHLRIHVGQNVLEVGAGSQGIAPYLKGRALTTVDQNYQDYSDSTNDLHPAMQAVIADASMLPFQDGAFAFVFSLDMIEHLPANMRESALIELLRVARKTIVVGFPAGEAAKTADSWYARILKYLRHAAPGWLEEHLSMPYPTSVELDRYLVGYEFTSYWHEPIWLHKLVYIVEFITAGYSKLDRILPDRILPSMTQKSGRYYRRFYVIEK